MQLTALQGRRVPVFHRLLSVLLLMSVLSSSFPLSASAQPARSPLGPLPAQVTPPSSPVSSNPPTEPDITPASGAAQAEIPPEKQPVTGPQVLLLTATNISQYDYIWRYSDGNWSKIKPPLPGQRWYYITADPFEPDRWLLLSKGSGGAGYVPLNGYYVGEEDSNYKLWYTENAGTTWEPILLPATSGPSYLAPMYHVEFSTTDPGVWQGFSSNEHNGSGAYLWLGKRNGVPSLTTAQLTGLCTGHFGWHAPGLNKDVVFAAARGTSCGSLNVLRGLGFFSDPQPGLQTPTYSGGYLYNTGNDPGLQIERLPGTSPAVVGANQINTSNPTVGDIWVSPDYRTTQVTKVFTQTGVWVTAAVDGVYVAGRGASGSGTGGIVRIDNLLTTPTRSSILVGDGVGTNYIRSDRRTRSVVAALGNNNQTLYLRPEVGSSWQTITIPTSIIDPYYFTGFFEVIAGSDAYPPDQGAVSECPCQEVSPDPGEPIDARTGNLWTVATDLAVQTPGPSLVWGRTYASQRTGDPAGILGPGWTHTYATQVITESMTGGEAGRVIVVSPKGNRWRYTPLGSGLAPFPGVPGTMVEGSTVYTQTLSNQQQYVFSKANGRLIAMHDGLGRQVDLTYDSGTGRLTQITDAADSSRVLALSYHGSGLLASVSDGTRTVEYSYNVAGDLETASDVMDRVTTYTYQSHLLTQITNPLGQATEQNVYDSYTSTGRAIEQTLQDGSLLEFQYLSNTTVVTTTGLDGWREVTHYEFDNSNALTEIETNGETVAATAFDGGFHLGAVSDGAGNVTQTTYSFLGLPLSQTNALSQTTRVRYDAKNRPLSAIDPLGTESRWRYDATGNVISTTVGISTTNPLGLTTLYNYTGTLLDSQSSPDGVVTSYTYNANDQVTSITVGDGTALEQTTGYEYDTLGRVVTTTLALGTALERSDITRYNDDNTISETIQNYQDGVFSTADPDQDIITTFGYDGLGRQIWVRDVLGRYDVTRYNAAGQVEATTRNVPGPLSFDGQGQPIIPAFSAAQPDRNVATFYGYDGLGRTVLVTETGILTGTFNTSTLQFSSATTRVTRTEYDALSRPITTTLNYRPGLPATADTNLQLITRYDGAGNVIWQRDAYERWTRIDYDALNRPIRTITNYEDGDPETGERDADIISETRYDSAGRVERQIENYVDGVFTATEPITDRVTLYEYDALSRPITTTLQYDPPTLGTRTDTNRVNVSAYEPLTGRMQGQRDPLGRWVSQQYDALGRVNATIQNCRNSGGIAVATGCAAFSSLTPDRNVLNETRYDALGRVYESVNPLGTVTRSTFDGLGRVTVTVQNYVDGTFSSAAPDTDVASSVTYDALGRAVSSTDPTGAVTTMAYNGLGQTSVITDAVGRVTRQGYDGTGALRWSRTPDGRVTVMQVDGLGRTVSTITNYQDGVVSGGEPSDRDLITQTVYDTAGRRFQAIDANGRVTQFAYDNLDRLIAVTENAVTGTCTNGPCNVVTQYQYDRAGNRTAIIDANGNLREFSYDAANQTTQAIDGLSQVTGYSYDIGGRLISTDDPRGSTNDLSYSYTGLDQPSSISATNLGTITQSYDALGRRTSLADATGTTSFDYDNLSRLTEVQAPNTGTVGYGYNARGDRTRLTYPDTTQIDYGYFPDGQLQVVTGTTTLASYAYDSAGRLDTVTRANGAVTNYDYDNADRLRDLRTTVSSVDTSRFQYDVDRVGMRRVVTETLGLSTPSSAFPSAAVRDDFNRANGAIGSNWVGSTSNFSIQSNTLDAGASGIVYWNGSEGADQEAYVTLTTIDPSAVSLGLVMKGQGTGQCDTLAVIYVPSVQQVQVWTCTTPTGWVQQGGASVTYTNGDQLGARATADGLVTVYRNGTLVASVVVASSWTYRSSGGRIGISTNTASASVFDNFGGGSRQSQPAMPLNSVRDNFNRANGAVGSNWLGGTANFSIQSNALDAGSSDVIYWNSTEAADQEAFVTLSTIDPSGGSLGVFLKGQGTGQCDAIGIFYRPTTQRIEVWTCTTPAGWTQLSGAAVTYTNGDVLGARATADGLVTVYRNGTLVASTVIGSGWAYRASGGRIGIATNTASASLFDNFGGGSLPAGGTATRSISYSYDGLQRLTSATESGATTNSYAYSYDNAGNRTGVWVNGTRTITQTYNAANQVVGWSYDAAGNLTSDGTTTRTWDALGRMLTSSSTSYAYNGDGVLVAETVGITTTRYTQDLASPLSQILSDGTNRYVYGHERLFGQVSSTRTWYSGDALGSVRQTLSDSGSVLGSVNYDPWGTPQGSAIAAFGFTGELQQGSGVYLRARWYTPGSGTLLGRDPFKGWDPQPQSLSYYTYVHNDSINATDPTGLWRWSGTSSIYHLVIEQIHLLRNNPVDVHVEYNDAPIYPLRVDVLHSNTGDVYEIEPIDKARDALPQAMNYVRILNEKGLHAGRYGNPPSLNGHYYGWPRPRRITPTTPGTPYNWNTVQWRLGEPANFPMIRFPWLVGPGNTIVAPNMRVADLVAISPSVGEVIYWLEPIDGTLAAAVALAAATWLSDRLKQPYSGSNTPNPRPLPPLPAPNPQPRPNPRPVPPLPAPVPAPLIPLPDPMPLPSPFLVDYNMC